MVVLLLLVFFLAGCDQGTKKIVQPAPPQSYQGRLQLPEGDPVAGASVYLIRDDTWALQAKTTSDSGGRFNVTLDPAGTYWLAVSKPGRNLAYVDTAFSVHEPVVIVRPPTQPPAAKPTQSGDLLGDIDGSGLVGYFDVMLMVYRLIGWPPIIEGLYDFSMGDIDRDGYVTWVDLALLGSWYSSGSPVDNDYGIGKPLSEPLTMTLTPSLSAAEFVPDESWHRFQVLLEGGTGNEKATIVVNQSSLLDQRVLEIATGRRPTISWCPAELNDRRTIFDSSGYFYLSACQAGLTSLTVEDGDGNILAFYVILVEEAEEESDGFNIELVFPNDSYTPSQKAMLREAADRWEAIITGDLPDQDLSLPGWTFDTDDLPWREWWEEHWKDHMGVDRIVVDDSVDDLRIFIGSHSGSFSSLGIGSVAWWRGGSTLPIVSMISMNKTALDTKPYGYMMDVILHEIGHALGFGTIWRAKSLLHNPSAENPGADSYFSGLNAISAFNRAGGNGYAGRKVPVENDVDAGPSTRDSHWREKIFGDEVMSTYGRALGREALSYGRALGREALSAITLAAMEDLGYQVDMSQADSYSLPVVAAKRPVTVSGRPLCIVIPSPWDIEP